MKSLKLYISESLINEGFIDNVKSAWKWFIGDDDHEFYGHDFGNITYDEDDDKSAIKKYKDKEGQYNIKINIDKLKFEEINNEKLLKEYIKSSKPDKEKDRGFWLFDEMIKKDEAYLKLNKEPWYIKYFAIMDNAKKPNQFGMVSYSLNYNDGSSLHVFGIQTDSKYSGNNLLDFYIKSLSKIAKDNKKDRITLIPHEESLIRVYEKYGFTKEQNNNVMYKNLK